MEREKKEFLSALLVPAALIILLWVIKLLEIGSGISLSSYGLHPRSLTKIYGILTMPLLHANINHLASNSIALFILLSGLYLFYKEKASSLFIQFYLISGSITWMIAKPGSVHIGASAIVYSLAWFHIISGFIKKNKRESAFGFLVVFLYGSVVWGIFPGFQTKPNISWQGHLAGGITGLIYAIYFRKYRIDPEEEEDVEEDEEDYEYPYWEDFPPE